MIIFVAVLYATTEQVDERIRKMLAAKDTELSSLRAVLRAKEGKLRSAEESLSLINNEIATIKKR